MQCALVCLFSFCFPYPHFLFSVFSFPAFSLPAFSIPAFYTRILYTRISHNRIFCTRNPQSAIRSPLPPFPILPNYHGFADSRCSSEEPCQLNCFPQKVVTYPYHCILITSSYRVKLWKGPCSRLLTGGNSHSTRTYTALVNCHQGRPGGHKS